MILSFRTKIQSEHDVFFAIHRAIVETQNMNFGAVRMAKLKTAISELGSNIVKYAGSGFIAMYFLEEGRKGVKIVAIDHGPGIADISVAMQDHYSTSGTLGLGLPGVRRLMDEFEIWSQPGQGTEVTITLYTQ